MDFVAIMLVFSAGSVYAAAYHGRRYEEALPLTLCLTTIVLYSFGWFNQLLLGVYAVCGAAACLYAYSLRPYQVSGSWSIGHPFFEGDIWTRTKSLEEWKRELDGYSYILLWQINPFFTETYGELFEDGIVPGALYRKTGSGTFRSVFRLEKNEIASFSGEMQGDSEFMQYVNVADVFDQHGVGRYTLEVEMKTSIPAATTVYLQNSGSSRYALSHTLSTTAEYETYSFTADVSLSDSGEDEAWLAFYSCTLEGAEAIPSVRSVRILKDSWVWSDPSSLSLPAPAGGSNSMNSD